MANSTSQPLTSSRVAELLCDCLLNNLTKEGRTELFTWLKANERNCKFFLNIMSPERRKALLSKPRKVDPEVASAIWNRISHRIAQSQSPAEQEENSFISAALLAPSN